MHQMIAKALHARYCHGQPVTFTWGELQAAAEAEYGYSIDDESGSMIFRPLTDDEKK